MKGIEYILEILHDLPTEDKCRYYSVQECLYVKEGDNGLNWCNNCFYWHKHIAGIFGVGTVYEGKPKGCRVMHASLVKDLYEKDMDVKERK